MSITVQIRQAAAAGTAQAAVTADHLYRLTDSDDRVAGRVTLWQGRLREAMVMAARQRTQRALSYVTAVALETELARRASVAHFSR